VRSRTAALTHALQIVKGWSIDTQFEQIYTIRQIKAERLSLDVSGVADPASIPR
jgi:hypothetical protein